MNATKSWFSFIELIVWISISMILMISVGVLVSSGMRNITIQKQILDENKNIQNFSQELSHLLSDDFNIVSQTATSLTLKSATHNEKPLYTKIEIFSQTGYCENDLDIETKNLKITRFNPFDLSITPWYSGSYLHHEVYSGSSLLIGKWHFWDGITPWKWWIHTYLNTPAWITSADSDKVIVSDYGNNRILYISGGLLYKFLDEKQGILWPTWIVHLGNALYILNSWKKELLKVTSPTPSNSWPIHLTFHNSTPILINRIDIEILPINWFSINGSYTPGDIILQWMSTGTWDIVNTNTGILEYSFDTSQTLNSGDGISIPSFSWTLSKNNTYYIKTSLYNSGNLTYSEYYPYIVKSDGDIFTTKDNTLTTLSGSLDYDYTILEKNAWDIVLKDIIHGKQTTMDSDGIITNKVDISTVDISTLEQDIEKTDFKIKNFEINTNSGILNIKIDYYKSFSCYNEKDSIVKTLLIKKVIP